MKYAIGVLIFIGVLFASTRLETEELSSSQPETSQKSVERTTTSITTTENSSTPEAPLIEDDSPTATSIENKPRSTSSTIQAAKETPTSSAGGSTANSSTTIVSAPSTTQEAIPKTAAPFVMEIVFARSIIVDQTPERSPFSISFSATCRPGMVYTLSIEASQNNAPLSEAILFSDFPQITCPDYELLEYNKELSLLYDPDRTYTISYAVSNSGGTIVERTADAQIRLE